jgi:tRNA dimethylallyltransferase
VPGARAGSNTILLIGGPTASGKPALALDLTTHFGGSVTDADSMQI